MFIIVPVVFETHGAAGPETCAMLSTVRHQFSNVALPCEDKSSEAVFFTAWMHRVSTTLQRGTALMIYNIARGNTTKARRTKEDEFEPEHEGEAEARPRGNTTKARKTKGDEFEPEDEGEAGARSDDTTRDSEIDLSEESKRNATRAN